MKNFEIDSFTYELVCDGEPTDAALSFARGENTLSVFLTATADRPQFVTLRWRFATEEALFVLGDAWERSYGELCFKKLGENDRPMPWYFAATDMAETCCFGVKTQPNAFVCFTYDRSGITAKIDCRNGGGGVALAGRSVKLCTFVFARFARPPFESLCAYCRQLCDAPLLPREKIYGGNNWYYAYGESSFADILRDAKLQAELARGIENRPFMVVDDGWSIHRTQGPYLPNEKFGDMKALAAEIKKLGVRPGLWIRLLDDVSEELTPEMRILRGGKREYLDPTNKTVQQYLRREIETVKAWGYELLKHDFSTVDLFGSYGKDLTDTVTNDVGWHFEDESKTNAEIVLDFYRLIKEACGDMLIIGCNTVSHLCAGLVQINRTGDDTSGRDWDRTRKMGVNTLAFRLAQNNVFYLADADCVGISGDLIPWEKNRQWLDVLSKSDTALFVSCPEAAPAQKADLRQAYLEIQKDHAVQPVDLFENRTPEIWEIDGARVRYCWD